MGSLTTGMNSLAFPYGRLTSNAKYWVGQQQLWWSRLQDGYETCFVSLVVEPELRQSFLSPVGSSAIYM